MGSKSACAVTEKSVDVTPMNARFEGNLTAAGETGFGNGRDRLEQSPDGLASVSSSTPELVEQLGSGPWRLASRVPLRQHV